MTRRGGQRPPGVHVVSGNQSSVAGGRFGRNRAKKHLEAYAGRREAIDWVMMACNVIGETAGSAPWYCETEDGKKLPANRKEADKGERIVPADLATLMRRPNSYERYSDLILLTVIDELITGDAFWYKFRPLLEDGTRPLSLWRLAPNLVEPVPGDTEHDNQDEMIVGYTYHVPGMQEVFFPFDEVIHFKRPNPHDMFRGAGIISGNPEVFDMEIALSKTKTRYYMHGAKLSGVLESERTIPDTTIQKYRRQFAGLYSSPENAYKVAVLERGLEFKPISNSAVEAEFAGMSIQSRDRILAAFGVPKSILGIESEIRQAEGAAQDDRRTFANNKMRPYLDKMQELISFELTEPGWDLSFKIDYEYQMTVEERLELAEKFATLPGVKLGEVREFADLPLLGDARDEMVLNLPGENDNDSEVKDPALGSEPGRPPKGENTAAVPKNGKLPADATAQR